MGYGWTDNWASSLTQARPVPGDIYTLTGLRTATGQGGPPTSGAMNSPGRSYVSARIPTSQTARGTGSRRSRARREPSGASTMTAGKIYTIAGSDTGAAGDSPNGTAAASRWTTSRMASRSTRREPVHRGHREPAGRRDPGRLGNLLRDPDDRERPVHDCGGGGHGRGGRGPAVGHLLGSGPAVGPGGRPGSARTCISRMRLTTGSRRSPRPAQTDWGQSMTTGDMYTVAGSSAGTSGTSGTAARRSARS